MYRKNACDTIFIHFQKTIEQKLNHFCGFLRTVEQTGDKKNWFKFFFWKNAYHTISIYDTKIFPCYFENLPQTEDRVESLLAWTVASAESVTAAPWTSTCGSSPDICGFDWDDTWGVAKIPGDDVGTEVVGGCKIVVCGEISAWAELWGAEPGASTNSSCVSAINESSLDDSAVRSITLPFGGSLVCLRIGEVDGWEWGRGAIRLWSLSPTVPGKAENLGWLKLYLKLKWFFR